MKIDIVYRLSLDRKITAILFIQQYFIHPVSHSKHKQIKLQILMRSNMLEMAQFKKEKCFFEATDPITFKVEILVLAVAITLMTIILVSMFKHFSQFKKTAKRKYTFKQIRSKFQFKVFCLLLCWGVAIMSKCSVNLYAYQNYMSDEKQDQILYQQLLPLSAYFYLADNLCTFALLTLLILIPFHWLRGLLNKVSDEKQRNLELYDRNCFQRIFKIQGIVAMFIKLRWAYVVLLVAIYFLLLFSTLEAIALTIWICVVLLDSILLIFYYFFGFLVSSYLRKKQLFRMKKEEYKALKIEYSALASCLFIRCFLNALFYLSSTFYHYYPNQNCTDRSNRNIIIRSLFLSLGEIIMHFLPILIIVYIYRPHRIKSSQKSLLGEGNSLDKIGTNLEKQDK